MASCKERNRRTTCGRSRKLGPSRRTAMKDASPSYASDRTSGESADKLITRRPTAPLASQRGASHWRLRSRLSRTIRQPSTSGAGPAGGCTCNASSLMRAASARPASERGSAAGTSSSTTSMSTG
eukprot:scaffold23434_cov135-Isochrysis_galbana.AAC.11